MFDRLPLPDVISGVCDIFSVGLNVTAAEYFACCDMLSESEFDRMIKLVGADHRREFAVTRGLLRSCLSRYVDCDPKALVFVYGDHGKPMLRDYPELQFNVSHSHGRSLIGVARGKAIGVDIEGVRATANLLGIARRFFMPSEYAAIAGDVETSPRVFFEYWTCKEAYLKATGAGLGQIGMLEISIEGGNVRVIQKPCEMDLVVARVALGDGFLGAIALEV